jgi:para-aminobenzoate synthetase component 1
MALPKTSANIIFTAKEKAELVTEPIGEPAANEVLVRATYSLISTGTETICYGRRFDLIKATFPGGSITGAPKIRAMEIIRELETAPRGPYCGAIGWLGLNGDMELNIAIRTALVDEQSHSAHFHAGSGIVADSDPEREYEETLHKARAFFTATSATLR